MHYKAIKTKLKLNNTQATLMARHAGFSRWVYNWGRLPGGSLLTLNPSHAPDEAESKPHCSHMSDNASVL